MLTITIGFLDPENIPTNIFTKKFGREEQNPGGCHNNGLSYKTQWRSQEVVVEGQNILSSSPLLMEMNKHIGGELRVKPKRRARSARDLMSKSESKAKSEIERGRSLGRGLGELISRKFLKIHT